YKTITNKNPVQMQFPYALWTREMVRELIENKYGIKISAVSVGRLLKKLGLSCQKPLMRAFQQDPVVTQEWVDKVYPKIKKEAKKEKAEIFFGDEAGVRSDYHGGTTWGVKGQTPIIRTTGARFSLNMLSAVSAQGGMRFMTHKGKVNSAVFCDFLNRLMHNAKNKIFLILDGHPVHKSLKVKRFIESTGGRLRIYYLPSYSPELNPDEQVWNNVKGKIGRSTIKGPDDLDKKVRGHLISLQRNPEKIRMFFQEPNVKYAA
ncbi:MAG: IS630 family transposase, partial [Patescibacteria group bacterium]